MSGDNDVLVHTCHHYYRNRCVDCGADITERKAMLTPTMSELSEVATEAQKARDKRDRVAAALAHADRLYKRVEALRELVDELQAEADAALVEYERQRAS